MQIATETTKTINLPYKSPYHTPSPFFEFIFQKKQEKIN